MINVSFLQGPPGEAGIKGMKGAMGDKVFFPNDF
jgi:hypothetical protein